MFDKQTFASIIKKIKEQYDTQIEFSQKTDVGRTYLSQYMNMKIDKPPKPTILKKIADNSKGVTTYSELMKVCGYIDDIHSFNKDILSDIKKLKIETLSLKEKYSNLNLNYEEEKILENYKIQKENLKNEYHNLFKNNENYQDMSATDDWYMTESSKLLDSVLDANCKNIRKDFISKALKILTKIQRKESIIKNYEELLKSDNTTHVTLENLTHSSVTIKIPVVGTVAAGEPILAQQNIIDYEELPASEYSDGEYFGLKIKGNSMFPRILEDDVVIVKRQTTAETGQIAVVLINGDEATVKQIKKTESGLMLIPFNTNEYSPMFFTKEDIENKPVKIIGIVKRLIGYNFW